MQINPQILLDDLSHWKTVVSVSKPKVINYQVNDICNSKCVMCNIWKNKRDEELSPEQLGEILKNPFFSDVEHVGITGGEPTLRMDLPEYYTVIADTLPSLLGASFISNGHLVDRTVELYTEIKESYDRLGYAFSGMISIDGLREVHDRVRGMKGCFERAVDSLVGLRQKGLNVIACCTIVKENVYHLHDLLRWGMEQGIYVRFRIAEFIKRLCNDDLHQQIRNFDSYERRHLVSFFHKLIYEYESDETVKRTYISILSLLTDGRRLVRCPYQSSGAVNLDSRGYFAHCAPKGTPHPLGKWPRGALLSHAIERLSININDCASCIHDYHSDWIASVGWLEHGVASTEKELYEIPDHEYPEEESPEEQLELLQYKTVLLVGWYGTETAGDIAILEGLIHEYLQVNPSLRFVLWSLFPYYTRLTLRQMDESLSRKITIVGYNSPLVRSAIEQSDAIIMAGGPLMDIPQTGLIAALFLSFYKRGKPRYVDGCGIGPLHIDRYRTNVIRACRLASRISVRDTGSRKVLQSFGIAKPIHVRQDPSKTFVQGTGVHHQKDQRGVIRCFLRQLTGEYPQDISIETATENVQAFVESLLEWYPEHRIELWAMHYFPIGNDDRQFAQQLCARIGNARLIVDSKPRTPKEILSAMSESEFCVCMRFHSVIFADSIAAPFVAIDYTNGGKVHHYLEDTNQMFRMVSLRGLGTLQEREFREKVHAEKN